MKTLIVSKTALTVATVVFGAALFTSTLSAAIINVDFQVTGGDTFSGQGAIRPAGSGTNWNGFNIPAGGLNPPNGQSMFNLLDEDGAATTVDVAFGTGWTGTYNATNTSNPLQWDRAYTAGADLGTFTISGLASGGAYNVALIGSGDLETEFTLGGTTITASGGSANSGFVDGVSHVYFSGVTATGGEITFTTRASGGTGNGALAGIQVQAVPEPASAALLLGLGSIALILRRRK